MKTETSTPAGLMTLAQFEDSQRADVLREYGISRAEYDELYPTGSRVDEWFAYLEEQASSGVMFHKAVCRSIVDSRKTGNHDLMMFQKFHRCIPQDVLLANGRTI